MLKLTLLVSIVTIALACDSGQASTPTAPTGQTPAGWLTYTDPIHGFAVAYPQDHVILDESPAAATGAVASVRFQLKRLVDAGATFEPPRFSVEVFQPGSSPTLEVWLRGQGRLPAGATVTRLTVANAREGLLVQLPQQLAPNQFYYLATPRFVYAFTALGEHGETMVASFRLF